MLFSTTGRGADSREPGFITLPLRPIFFLSISLVLLCFCGPSVGQCHEKRTITGWGYTACHANEEFSLDVERKKAQKERIERLPVTCNGKLRDLILACERVEEVRRGFQSGSLEREFEKVGALMRCVHPKGARSDYGVASKSALEIFTEYDSILRPYSVSSVGDMMDCSEISVRLDAVEKNWEKLSSMLGIVEYDREFAARIIDHIWAKMSKENKNKSSVQDLKADGKEFVVNDRIFKLTPSNEASRLKNRCVVLCGQDNEVDGSWCCQYVDIHHEVAHFDNVFFELNTVSGDDTYSFTIKIFDPIVCLEN